MTDKQEKVPGGTVWLKIGLRVCVFLFMAAAIGAVLNRIANSLEHNSQPAGFTRGMLQGALMPMSLPNLLVGRDVTIYSQNNTGVSYKLGYTTGVNGCGALFFGVVFWRVMRLRRWATMPKSST
jgi:hypothetical protein